MAKSKKRREAETPEQLPIAKAEDIHYTVPLDEEDWEARKRMEAADHRADK
ncbi:hypothetical protein ACFO4N_11205 [Camelliibacillus cellulosilyticus]|uniref:YfhD-like protein n=1 Tax=Camelliibacillus cellulosilyticus TaxID=2174486 RepID=A0ABV9GPR2_9BACL